MWGMQGASAWLKKVMDTPFVDKGTVILLYLGADYQLGRL